MIYHPASNRTMWCSADDTAVYYLSSMISNVESKVNADLANITVWFNSNCLTLNFEKSNFLLLGSSRKLKSCGTIELVVSEKKLNSRVP